MDKQCHHCHIQSFNRLLDYFELDKKRRKSMSRRFFTHLNAVSKDQSPAEMARDVHSWFRSALNSEDPYAVSKMESNKKMLGLYPEFKQTVARSRDPFETALRLAIGGNIIDMGPSTTFDIEGTIERVLSSPLAIDHSGQLKRAMHAASNLLYLADNAGEIVMDKLFLETAAHPRVTLAVRKAPVLNDATPEDAQLVGIDKIARVITNGDDAPSTLLHRTSREFNSAFDRADCVIAKGMGNLEGLYRCRKKNLFFLLIVKCQYIGDVLGVKIGDFIVCRNPVP